MTDEMIDINPSTEELNEILKRLRLGCIRKHIEKYLQKCTEAKLTPRQTIAFILGKEGHLRIEHGIQIKTNMASFPTPASLANFEFPLSKANQALFEELALCHWIAQSENLLFYGESGLGKRT